LPIRMATLVIFNIALTSMAARGKSAIAVPRLYSVLFKVGVAVFIVRGVRDNLT